MIYLILFGLDFYSNIVSFVSLCSILGVVAYICMLFFIPMLDDMYQVRQKRKDPSYKGEDSFDKLVLLLYDVGCKLLKSTKLLIALVIFASILPNAKTVYVATGLVSGDYVVSSLKNNPLGQKVYQIAEQKLDNIIGEQLESKDKK